MFTKILTCLGLLLATNFPLHALVETTIDPKSSLEVTFSLSAPNRISFEGGSITDIIVDTNACQSFLHQKTGQAFLTPLKEFQDVPTSVTLMTSSGETQTLSIFSTQKEGEIVLLTSSEKTSSPYQDELSFDYHSLTIDFLNQLLCGNIPSGYGIRELQNVNRGSLALPAHLCLTPLRLLEGPFEEIFLAEIFNSSKKKEILSSSSLKKAEDLWVFLSNPYLEPKETTLVIIATPKKER